MSSANLQLACLEHLVWPAMQSHGPTPCSFAEMLAGWCALWWVLGHGWMDGVALPPPLPPLLFFLAPARWSTSQLTLQPGCKRLPCALCAMAFLPGCETTRSRARLTSSPCSPPSMALGIGMGSGLEALSPSQQQSVPLAASVTSWTRRCGGRRGTCSARAAPSSTASSSSRISAQVVAVCSTCNYLCCTHLLTSATRSSDPAPPVGSSVTGGALGPTEAPTAPVQAPAHIGQGCFCTPCAAVFGAVSTTNCNRKLIPRSNRTLAPKWVAPTNPIGEACMPRGGLGLSTSSRIRTYLPSLSGRGH